jgi:hypothetical protein
MSSPAPDDKQEKNDVFNDMFREFSTQHSWYKIAGEHSFYLIPQKLTDENLYSWTWHQEHGMQHAVRYGTIPTEIQLMITKHSIPLQGMVYSRYGHNAWLHILGEGGWPLLGQLEQKGYKKAVDLIRQHCRDNAHENDSRYKIWFNGKLDMKRWCIRKMILAEYHRMRELAREQFYQFLSELYPWFILHGSKPLKPESALEAIAKTYLNHVQTLQQTLISFNFPSELGSIVILYHHTF